MKIHKGDDFIYSQRQLSYVIRHGDNLYHLAKYYRTTVPAILSLNPNIDPYNLQIGSSVVISPGEDYVMQHEYVNPLICPDFSKQTGIINGMRAVWEQHVYWTRLLIISIAERLKDQSEVTERILQNPYDVAKIYANYYNAETANKIAQLLTEHLQIGAKLITALRDKKIEEADNLNRQWYANADKMAEAFSSINPYYKYDELREMLYTHLKLTAQEVDMRLAGNYKADIEAFNKVEQEALSMADYFTDGIIKQFPQKFMTL